MSNLQSAHAGQRREYIKFQLRMRGSSFADLSRELGVSKPTVSQVCGGKRTSERVLRAVAAKLGEPVDVLREAIHRGGSVTR